MNDDIAQLALKMGKIWNPEMRIMNAFEKRRSDNIRIYVFNDGTIVMREIFTVNVRSFFNLSKIPFDDHWLKLQIGSMTWDKDQMHIIKEEMLVEFADDFMIPGWLKTGFGESISHVFDKKTNRTFSTLETELHIVRSSYINLFKIMIPVSIFIFVTSLT